MNEVTNNDDVIDSRDVIARIEELEDQHIAVVSAEEGAEWTEEDAQELAALRKLADEGESLEDWQHGATLIRYTYFTEYAKQLADDIGATDANASWPLNHIDWEAAADDLHQDYTEVTFDGVTYFAR